MPTQQDPDGGKSSHSRRPAPSANPQAKFVALALAIAAVAVTGWWQLNHGDDRLPTAYHQQVELRKAGEFDRARRLLRGLNTGWASGSVSRLATVDAARRQLKDTATATAELRARLSKQVRSRTFAQQIDELKQLSTQDTTASAEAAQIVLGKLTGLRSSALAKATRHPKPEFEGSPPTAKMNTVEATIENTDLADEAAVAAVLESVGRLTEAGQHAQALETLGQALATAAAKHAEPLRERLSVQRTAARDEIDRVVVEARAKAAAGRLDEAVTFLLEQATRFPQSGSLSGISREVESLRIEARAKRERARQVANIPTAAVPDEQAINRRRASLGLIADVMDQVRAAELSGDFAGGAAKLADAADRVSERDPVFAQRLHGQAKDLGHIAALSAMVERALSAGGECEVVLRGGNVGHITGVTESALQVETNGSTRQLGWPDMQPRSVCRLVDELQGGPAARLGAAVLAYRGTEPELAESSLARVLKADPTMEAAVWGILRRNRAGLPDTEGYKLVAGKFVGLQEIAAQKLAAKLERRLAAMLRSPADKRDQLIHDLLVELGPQAVDGLLIALERTQSTLAAKLENHVFRKRVHARLAKRREELDQRRAHAIELIYDEEKYFYPYKVPAVSSEKAAEYWPVQRDVDERVEALRQVWEGTAPVGRIPANLREDLRRFQWVTKMLGDFGKRQADAEARAAWVMTLPDVAELNLQNFCKDTTERDAWQLHDRIEQFNTLQCRKLGSAERRQIEVTNEYRRMFGHRPLAVNLKVQDAARGHCQEMSKLGFFGHFSPTPGRRTPFDRMKLAGYTYGASENCAINGSAVGAHMSWLHSSGHHRNLLRPSHTEFGSSNDGRYWTQNFGGGEEFLVHPRFPE